MENKTTYVDLMTTSDDDSFVINGCGQFDHEGKVLTKAEALLLYVELHKWLTKTNG